MSDPLVSVIIPVFNREETIERAVDSALKQTYGNCEVIVVDDGSTDRTAELLIGYNSRITLVRQPNAGPSAARNRGVGISRGEILAFLDSDDSWSIDKISKQVELLLRGGDRVPCCICNALILSKDEDGVSSFDSANVRSNLEAGFWLNPDEIIASRFILFNQVVAVRKSAFSNVGGFREDLEILEDYDLALRLSLLGPWAFVSEILVQKFNDAGGIGVLAMSEERIHSRAWKKVLEAFLVQNLDVKPAIRNSISSTLRDVCLWITALNLLDRGKLSKCIGRSLLIYSHCLNAIRRRLPSWPRPKVVADLD